jgi:hypothetical protein
MSTPANTLSPDRAWSCITMNLALPGTGTIRAGRPVSGYAQLLLGIGGALLVCIWIVWNIFATVQAEINEATVQGPGGWMWELGAGMFVVSLLWTLVTCVDLYRKARADEKKAATNVPPRLTDLPNDDSEKH